MMRLAALQMRVAVGDTAANLDRIEKAARETAKAGATLLITPELSLVGYGAGERMHTLAEPADGPLLARLAEVSNATGVAIVAGLAERIGDAIHNSAAYVNGGQAAVVYRKSHLFGAYERALFQPAEPSTVIFEHDGLRCGMLICYDVEFPENVRRLALAGADAVLAPTALPAGTSSAFIADHMIQTRAFENQLFVAYVNHCGADERFGYAGLSRIAAPDGNLLAEAGGSGEALLIADLVPAGYEESRRQNTYLADLRR